MELINNNLDEIIANNDNTGRKRNNVGIVSFNYNLIEEFGDTLSKQDFNLTSLSLDELANGNHQNFYFIDLEKIDDFDYVAEQIKTIREKNPDTELVLLQQPSLLSRPIAFKLKESAERYLVHRYNILSPGEPGYEKSLQLFIEQASECLDIFLSKPNMLKIGGSIWDLHDKNPEVMMKLLEEVYKLHSDGYPIIVTTGGSHRLSLEDALKAAYGISPRDKQVLKVQAEDIARLLGKEAKYISPGKVKDFKFTESYLRDNIPVVSLSGDYSIPDKESDTHTLRIGEKNGVYKVIFAKDADGVYDKDPYKFSRRMRLKLGFPPLQVSLEPDNKFHPFIYATDILNGVIDRRDAEGKGEHLIETGALMYLKDKTEHVRAVQVINGTKPELLRGALDGKFVGSYILKG